MPASSQCRACATNVADVVSGNSQMPVRRPGHLGRALTSARQKRVLGRDLGEQAEPVRHAVDVAVVGDDVVEVEDVEVVEADLSQRVDVGGGHRDRLLRKPCAA